MKILFIHNEYKFKGGEDAVLEAEINLLKQRGHHVYTMVFSNNHIEGLIFKVKAGLNSIYSYASARKVEEAVKSFGPDIIHIHNLFFEASPSVILKANKLNVPIVMTIHNYRLMCVNALFLRDNKVCELCRPKLIPWDGIKYQCYRSSYLESATVAAITSTHKLLNTWSGKVTTYIALSEFMKRKLIDSALKLPKEKVIVKPNFIDDIEQISNERNDSFLFVGRLSAEKGINILLEAFTKNKNLNLIIAGDGPDKELVISKTEALSNIKYVGSLAKNEVIQYMRSCQALIFPSIWYEGLPMTIIEAFATATPVLASNIGVMSEMINEGINGFHFEANNSDQLLATLERFLQLSMYDRRTMQMNARKTYLEKYHPDIHYQSIKAIYEASIKKLT